MIKSLSIIILIMLVLTLSYLLYDSYKCDSDSFICKNGDTKTCIPNQFKTLISGTGLCSNLN
uniref:Late nodulin n=1 Tax=viral metagenome TaxID=1070528 RepID=A0A6C0LT22_9ZZZZ